MQNVLLFSDKSVKAMNEKVNNLLSTIFLLCSQVALQSRDALGYSEFAPANSEKFPARQGQCLIPWEPIWNPFTPPHPPNRIITAYSFFGGGQGSFTNYPKGLSAAFFLLYILHPETHSGKHNLHFLNLPVMISGDLYGSIYMKLPRSQEKKHLNLIALRVKSNWRHLMPNPFPNGYWGMLISAPLLLHSCFMKGHKNYWFSWCNCRPLMCDYCYLS